jgi:hypothetical protein
MGSFNDALSATPLERFNNQPLVGDCLDLVYQSPTYGRPAKRGSTSYTYSRISACLTTVAGVGPLYY